MADHLTVAGRAEATIVNYVRGLRDLQAHYDIPADKLSREQLIAFLAGRKAHISNHRIVDINEHNVQFRYKDYRQKGKNKVMQLAGTEFLRRFCLHILPPGFRRMRHYGILSNARKTEALAAARKNLGVDAPQRRTSAERKAQLLERYFPDLPKTCTSCGCIDSIRQLRFAPGGTTRAPPLVMEEPRK